MKAYFIKHTLYHGKRVVIDLFVKKLFNAHFKKGARNRILGLKRTWAFIES